MLNPLNHYDDARTCVAHYPPRTFLCRAPIVSMFRFVTEFRNMLLRYAGFVTRFVTGWGFRNMGRPRKFASDAERQAAYRLRRGGGPEPVLAKREPTVTKVGPVRVEVERTVKKSGCGFPTQRGLKCKICGKVHL